MIARLGNVLYWIACGVAVLFLIGAGTAVLFISDPDGRWIVGGGCIVGALGAYLFALAARYVLGGGSE